MGKKQCALLNSLLLKDKVLKSFVNSTEYHFISDVSLHAKNHKCLYIRIFMSSARKKDRRYHVVVEVNGKQLDRLSRYPFLVAKEKSAFKFAKDKKTAEVIRENKDNVRFILKIADEKVGESLRQGFHLNPSFLEEDVDFTQLKNITKSSLTKDEEDVSLCLDFYVFRAFKDKRARQRVTEGPDEFVQYLVLLSNPKSKVRVHSFTLENFVEITKDAKSGKIIEGKKHFLKQFLMNMDRRLFPPMQLSTGSTAEENDMDIDESIDESVATPAQKVVEIDESVTTQAQKVVEIHESVPTPAQKVEEDEEEENYIDRGMEDDDSIDVGDNGENGSPIMVRKRSHAAVSQKPSSKRKRRKTVTMFEGGEEEEEDDSVVMERNFFTGELEITQKRENCVSSTGLGVNEEKLEDEDENDTKNTTTASSVRNTQKKCYTLHILLRDHNITRAVT